MAGFDPYHRWLGIPSAEQPADHYRLLGLARFEDDTEVICDAAERQVAHLRRNRLGEHAADAERILVELASARKCLLNDDERTKYDAQLRAATAQLVPQNSGPLHNATDAPEAKSLRSPTARPKFSSQASWGVQAVAVVVSILAIGLVVAIAIGQYQRAEIADAPAPSKAVQAPFVQDAQGESRMTNSSAGASNVEGKDQAETDSNGIETRGLPAVSKSKPDIESTDESKGAVSANATGATGSKQVITPNKPSSKNSGTQRPSEQDDLKSRANMKRIVLAFHSYHDKHGSFPPAYTLNSDGTRRASWRALILPYLKSAQLQGVVDTSVSWDDPKNSRARSTQLSAYRNPMDTASPDTHYFLITGRGTAFDGAKTARITDLTIGTSNVVLGIELLGMGVEWSDPRDLEIGELSRALDKHSARVGADREINVFLADGRIDSLPLQDARRQLASMVQIASTSKAKASIANNQVDKPTGSKAADKKSSTASKPKRTKKNRAANPAPSPLDTLLLRNRVLVGRFHQRNSPVSVHTSRIVILRKSGEETWQGRWEFASQTMQQGGRTHPTGYTYGVTIRPRRPKSTEVIIHAKGVLANPRRLNLYSNEFSTVAKIVNGRIVGNDVSLAPGR